MKKIRLLTLTSLAATKKQLKYSDIHTCLKIKSEETELYILEALQNDLIRGTMDQLAHTFNVEYACPRVFAKKEWEGLRDSIKALKTKFEGVDMVGH
jgi:hypothetical protein